MTFFEMFLVFQKRFEVLQERLEMNYFDSAIHGRTFV